MSGVFLFGKIAMYTNPRGAPDIIYSSFIPITWLLSVMTTFPILSFVNGCAKYWDVCLKMQFITEKMKY